MFRVPITLLAMCLSFDGPWCAGEDAASGGNGSNDVAPRSPLPTGAVVRSGVVRTKPWAPCTDDDRPGGHRGPVRSVAIAADSKTLASASLDGTVRLRTSQISAEMRGCGIGWMPKRWPSWRTYLSTAGRSRFHRAATWLPPRAARRSTTMPASACGCPAREPALPTACLTIRRSGVGRLLVRRKATGDGGCGPRGGFAIPYDPDERDGSIEVWDRKDFERFHLPIGKGHKRRLVKDFPCGGALSQYATPPMCLRWRIRPMEKSWLPRGRSFFGQGSLTFWDTTSGALIREIVRKNWYVGHVAFSPDGQVLATTSSFGIHETKNFKPNEEWVPELRDPRQKVIELWDVAKEP